MERGRQQQPVYYVRKVIKALEVRYSLIENLALVVVLAAKKLNNYFQAHPIGVRTSMPLEKVLYKPELIGRFM